MPMAAEGPALGEGGTVPEVVVEKKIGKKAKAQKKKAGKQIARMITSWGMRKKLWYQTENQTLSHNPNPNLFKQQVEISMHDWYTSIGCTHSPSYAACCWRGKTPFPSAYFFSIRIQWRYLIVVFLFMELFFLLLVYIYSLLQGGFGARNLGSAEEEIEAFKSWYCSLLLILLIS